MFRTFLVHRQGVLCCCIKQLPNNILMPCTRGRNGGTRVE
jgi:hypothetical protein